MTTLYRAASDDSISQGVSFATSREVAEAYHANPGFGGATLYSAETDAAALDLTEVTVAEAAEMLGLADPGAIGVDEWLPRTPSALDAIRELGHLWVAVSESYPEETITWIWCGTALDDEPELEEIA